MLFNSTIFFQFLGAFLLLYFLCRNSITARNVLIVLGSWLFYGWWDYRFLGLLIFSGCFDYACGLGLAAARAPNQRKLIAGFSIAANLSLLGFFKYYDFFIGSLAALFAKLNLPFRTGTLDIILPVGISFYTFQSLSYVIDVYRHRQTPTRDLLQYLAYVSFFPQLVAGPIQRGHQLLPQLARTLKITLEMLQAGVWLIIWGLFKKVVIADNLANQVNLVFDHPDVGAPAILGGVLAFGVQIYCDFSGYSDMACGLANILGFEITRNFELPYFSKNVREFWSRWHISLSTWLRDYLYISLGGNRRGERRTKFNLMVTMLLGGLWHGAAWNFVLWGSWHGMGLIVNRWWRLRPASSQLRLPHWLDWPITITFVLYGWLIFRAGSLQSVTRLTAGLSNWSSPHWLANYWVSLLLFTFPLATVELSQKFLGDDVLTPRVPLWLRRSGQSLLILGILVFWEKRSLPFIYFQF